MNQRRQAQRKARQTWWRAGEDEPPASPLLTLHLWGLEDRRLDAVLTVAVLAVLVVSRVAAFPATIWDQDEAYFTAAVVHFNPLANQPHPPWFPLWILIGKALAPLLRDPARGLQLVSAFASVWIVFPLTALWSGMLRRPLAAGTAVLYCLAPGVWLLSGRAFTEPAATALLALAAAAWFAWEHRWARVLGSLAAGACLLVRPHFVVALLPLLVLALIRHGGRRAAAEIVTPAALLAVAGFGWMTAAAGGPRPLLAALETHAAVHFTQLAGFTPSFGGLGLSRALVLPAAAAVWLVLAAAGALAAWRRARGTLVVAAGVLVPLGLLVGAASDPEHTRYWLPLLAFSAGLVVLGLVRLAGRWTAAALVALVIASVAAVLPALSRYHDEPSPAVAATRFAFDRARASGSVVVADRSLVSFIAMERAERPFPGSVILDSQIELGETVPPPPFATVYLWAEGRPSLLARADAVRRFGCATPLLRRLEQERFLDVEVDTGAALR